MSFPETVPLVQWDDGSVRVHGSRVTLHTIVARFQEGDTPEDIQDGFPTLSLSQINAVIGWYLDHQAEVDEFIREEDAEAEALWKKITSRPGYKTFWERIASRRTEPTKT